MSTEASRTEASRTGAQTARRSIVLAGGGTGGHISPGIAIAEALQEMAPEFDRVFACSTRAVDARMLEHVHADFTPIEAEGLSLKPAKILRFAQAFLAGRAAARELLERRQASAVIALGGYVTGPVVAAARKLRIPILLVNLDATPGKANRWVARHARCILTACPTPTRPDFAERMVGMPVRRAAIAALPAREARERLGLEPGLHTLLVTGASQGAASLNDLLRFMVENDRAAFGGWQILHLVGNADPTPIEAAYRAASVRARVMPFLHDMGLAWGAADLVLSRAGANSVAEALLNAVPTVYAPYPYHADLHQKWNAQPAHDDGVAMLCDDLIDATKNRATLGAALISLMTDHARRESMRAKLLARPRENASQEIARVAIALASAK